MPPKSILWKYFSKAAASPNTAMCKLCHKNFKTAGNTSNLKYHLQAKHKDVYNSIFKSNNSRDTDTEPESGES